MEFDSLIKKDLIYLDIPVSSREEALRYLAGILVEKGYVKVTFPESIIEREKSNPTGLPMSRHKIAIPHTTSDQVLESALIFARLKNEIEFEEMGGDPGSTLSVRLVSMFALKEKKLIGDLLEALITAYQDEEMMDQIIRASQSDEVYDILKKKVGHVS